MSLPRSPASWNFLVSIAVGIAWFGYQAWVGFSEPDPTKLRITRIPLGASMIIVIELLLLVLYIRGGELIGMVRLFAALMGLVQGLQIVVGAIAGVAEGMPFPTPNHWAMGYLALSNVVYALFGEGRRRPA
jgi:hypothetical protein